MSKIKYNNTSAFKISAGINDSIFMLEDVIDSIYSIRFLYDPFGIEGRLHNTSNSIVNIRNSLIKYNDELSDMINCIESIENEVLNKISRIDTDNIIEKN